MVVHYFFVINPLNVCVIYNILAMASSHYKVGFKYDKLIQNS